jgi:hypothetical protein
MKSPEAAITAIELSFFLTFKAMIVIELILIYHFFLMIIRSFLGDWATMRGCIFAFIDNFFSFIE